MTPRTEIGVLERRLVYSVLYRFYGENYADMTRMEGVLHRSDAAWTILRPPMLTDRPGTGRFRTATNRHLPHGRTISRADLATAMLRLLDDPQAVGTTVGVAY